MNSSHLSNLPSVRLASGIEMQQRWPAYTQQQQQQQKNNEVPHLLEISPARGSEGTVVTIVVESLPHQVAPVKLAFNSLVVSTKQMQAQGITSLIATVPPFQHTRSTSAHVPVSICIFEGDAASATWPIADFFYEDVDMTRTPNSSSASLHTSLDYPEKRNGYTDPNYQNKTDDFLSTSSSNSNYGQFYQQPINNNYGGQCNSYPYSRESYGINKFSTYRPNSQDRTNSDSSINYNTNSVQFFNGADYNMLNNFNQPESQGSLGLMQNQHHSSHYGYAKSTVHIPATSVANYQPYPGLISRVNLKIIGDLEAMAKSWSPVEWENRRRLVQFWREQNGNEIRCTFDSLPQSERTTNNSCQIVVSCIYWAERNDCFITSVDCIHLLESLMDIRFSVEEKNRVRRNLEGFRPLTVSKCKADSAEFFKLIMGFPNPKPRNIEKDVKVFPWKTLPYALKKIITKYTASSYANHQHRRSQVKSVNTQYKTSPVMSEFYPQTNIYSPPYSQENHSISMYPPTTTSSPAFSSTYIQSSQQMTSSPMMERHSHSPSPPRLQYPSYQDLMTSGPLTVKTTP